MNAAALSDLGRELGLEHFSETAAMRLSRTYDEVGAEQLVRGAAALLDLASAVGIRLDQQHAFERMRVAALIYELAADCLLEPVRRRKQHEFSTTFDRLERAFFGDEAKARHAVFVGHLMDGSLGYRASMLLLAADDAGLRSPSASDYRSKLVLAIGGAIGRLYPIHLEPDWQVRDAEDVEPKKHDKLLAEARRDELRARELAVGRIPDLAVRIDRLRDRRLKNDVRAVLAEISKRLAERAEEGWVADPEAYYRQVVEPAAAAARRVA